MRSIRMIPPVRSTRLHSLDHATHPRRASAVLLLIISALVHATMVGTPAVLWVNVPGPNRSTVPWRALDVARSSSEDGSV
jgi:hypothetical protein